MPIARSSDMATESGGNTSNAEGGIGKTPGACPLLVMGLTLATFSGGGEGVGVQWGWGRVVGVHWDGEGEWGCCLDGQKSSQWQGRYLKVSCPTQYSPKSVL